MSGTVSRYTRKKWERRALTIHRRSLELFRDMMEALGPDHPATDYADNLIDDADHLAEILGKDTLSMWTGSPS